jgi:hypothetical protein
MASRKTTRWTASRWLVLVVAVLVLARLATWWFACQLGPGGSG